MNVSCPEQCLMLEGSPEGLDVVCLIMMRSGPFLY